MKNKIFCINLFERKDKYNFMKKQFKNLNLKVKFIINKKHIKGGRFGCFKSHIQCVKKAADLI